MTTKFFVDTNVLVYPVTAGPRREPTAALLDAIASGRAEGRSSVSVLEEVWHLELSGRVPEVAGQTRRARALFDDLLVVTPSTFDRALALQAPAGLGANDRLHVATCVEHEIGVIVTADRGFDAVDEVERVDPLDGDAVSALLS